MPEIVLPSLSILTLPTNSFPAIFELPPTTLIDFEVESILLFEIFALLFTCIPVLYVIFSGFSSSPLSVVLSTISFPSILALLKTTIPIA